ncbi:MAG: 2'-5' RNA ligase family protein [Sarcina sp.]
MKYYLVALFDDESYERIEPIQKNVLKRFRLPRHQLSSHITLKTLDNPDIEDLDSVLLKIFKPYKKFKVELTGDIFCYESNSKNINLKIENKGYINKIHRSLNDMLKLHGFVTREDRKYLSVAISTGNSSNRDRKEHSNALVNKGNHGCDTLKIDRIELWKVSSKKETILKSYNLRTY